MSQEVAPQLPRVRDIEFDNMKGILIFLVVIAHFMNVGAFPFVQTKALYIFIYFFHMPAFIFIAGYFSKNPEKARDKAVKSYLIPYILLTIFSWADIYLLAGKQTAPVRLFNAPTGCWFLFALFVFKVLLKDVTKFKASIPLLFLTGILSGFSDEFSRKLSLARLCVFFVFFLLGYYTNKSVVEKIRKVPKMITALIVVGIAGMSYYIAKEDIFPTKLLQCRTFYRHDSVMLDLKVRILFYLVSIIMIFCLINLCSKRKTVWTEIGKNSLSVYILHLFIVRRIDLYLEGKEDTITDPYIYLGGIILAAFIAAFLFSRQPVHALVAQFIKLVQGIIYKRRA